MMFAPDIYVTSKKNEDLRLPYVYPTKKRGGQSVTSYLHILDILYYIHPRPKSLTYLTQDVKARTPSAVLHLADGGLREAAHLAKLGAC